MSTIIFQGNTYTFGATVSANPGIGTTSYVFGGLGVGSTYGFIIWAFNSGGTSSIDGPATIITLSEVPPELRSEISSFAWSYQYKPGYDITYTSSGTTYNYLASSADMSTSSPWKWPTTAGYTRTTGYTAPDGSTTAWDFYSNANNSSKYIAIDTFGEIGATFILSYYVDLTNTYTALGNWQRPGHNGNQWTQIDSETGAVYSVTPDAWGNAKVVVPVGATGWTRFTYRWYNNTSSAQMNLAMLWYGGGPTLSARIWGPQLERIP